MNTGALIMMITCYTCIISMAGYFFYRVVTSKPKPDNPNDQDSYSENNPDDDSNKT